MKLNSIFVLIISMTLVFSDLSAMDLNSLPAKTLTTIHNLLNNSNQDIFDARRGGGGGSRRSGSIGGSRRSSSSSSSRSRSTTTTSKPRTDPKKTPSFGGSRTTKAAAQKKYGTPRKTETITGKNAAGQPVSYRMNSYGGYGSGLMTGYMMGATPFYWSMPFHPAFYYSRPVYVSNPDGSMDVYPPRFSFGKLLITLIIIAAIIFIIRRIIKNRKANSYSQSSFG